MALITPQIAREYAAKSAEVRRANATSANKPVAQAETTFEYAGKRLMCVREQLDALDERLGSAIAKGDGKLIESLARAQANLSEQERILAGRPLPGSHRPSAPRTKAKPSQFGPLD